MSEVTRSSVPADELTVTELRSMLAACDDNAGDHIIWVDHDGLVHIELLNDGLTPAGWAGREASRIRFRWETYIKGNGYVGEGAAADAPWVSEVLSELSSDWTSRKKGYVDY